MATSGKRHPVRRHTNNPKSFFWDAKKLTNNRKPSGAKGPARRSGGKRRRSAGSGVGVRRTKSGDGWVMVHPRSVRDRAEDMEEVRAMIDAGETDIAIDELRWLLSGCSEFIEAHSLLGELALAEDNDVPLARAHFGFAYQMGLKALRRAKSPTPLPYRLSANQAFFEAGKALAWCLVHLDKRPMAVEVLKTLIACDPSGPLGLPEMLEETTRKS